jgi:FixJ family two-component response regulator
MTELAEASSTLFVVDDDEQMRESLSDLLKALGFAVRAFGDPNAFLHHYRADMPGALLLDLRMPGMDGLQLYEHLLREKKPIPVIFITAHADVSSAVAAMKSGAIEFLEKPFDRHVLLDRVRKALALDARWRARQTEFAAIEGRIGRLSQRQRETLELLLAGESNKTMAARLLLTERAVEMRRASLMRTLRVGSLAELLDLAVTHRILTELHRAADAQRF